MYTSRVLVSIDSSHGHVPGSKVDHSAALRQITKLLDENLLHEPPQAVSPDIVFVPAFVQRVRTSHHHEDLGVPLHKSLHGVSDGHHHGVVGRDVVHGEVEVMVEHHQQASTGRKLVQVRRCGHQIAFCWNGTYDVLVYPSYTVGFPLDGPVH